jgi:8-amino-7-oxononanoate synthase
MGKDRDSSLEQYARRRFVLSGTAVVKDHFPYCQPVDSLSPDGSNLTSFAHYDYLGLGNDERVRAAAIAAIENDSVGAGASRLVGGERTAHRALERELAEFFGVEDTLSLVSGYGTNVALVSHLLTKDDLILVDESCHNSIMVGTQLSRATTLPFRHNDLDHLKALVRQRRSEHSRALIVVEGLYSMDGDIPDLPRLLDITRANRCWLMIDEAHSIGVLGETGQGISEHFGIPAAEIDLIVGTLSKAFVSCGGFIAGKRGIIDWLRFTLPGFVYSVGLPPPSVAAARAALDVLKSEPERLARLISNSRHFLSGARQRGLDVGSALGAAVIPILFDTAPTAIDAGNAILAKGFFVPPIVQIAVPKDAPRLRFFVTARHTLGEIDRVLDALEPFAVERGEAKRENTYVLTGSAKMPNEGESRKRAHRL